MAPVLAPLPVADITAWNNTTRPKGDLTGNRTSSQDPPDLPIATNRPTVVVMPALPATASIIDLLRLVRPSASVIAESESHRIAGRPDPRSEARPERHPR
jgi:hypothetical protein